MENLFRNRAVRRIMAIVPSWFESIRAARRLKSLQRAIARLPEPARSVFIRHRADGASFDEIAEELGVTPAQAKELLIDAMVMLVQDPEYNPPH